MPSVRPFFQDDYATIDLDESIPCIRMRLNGLPRHSEHYQLVQFKRLELMQREVGHHKLLHMLTDSRTAGPVLGEDVTFFRLHILPAMQQAGIRYLAIVMPESLFTRMTV